MRKVTRLGGRIAAALATAIISFSIFACDPPVNGVRVETGVTPLHPVFVLTDSGGRGNSGIIYGLSVVPCGSDSAVWQLASAGSKSAPARLTYGEAPDGFVAVIGPTPLRSGCYDVFITNGRKARFRVDAQRRVVPAVPAKRDSVARDSGSR